MKEEESDMYHTTAESSSGFGVRLFFVCGGCPQHGMDVSVMRPTCIFFLLL